MPNDKKLLWKCREEVLMSRGLNSNKWRVIKMANDEKDKKPEKEPLRERVERE